MRDVRLVRVAGRQFNRVSRGQMREFGFPDDAIDARLRDGRLVAVEQGVFALPPVLDHDLWGRWMGATLTAPGTLLCRHSAIRAWGISERGVAFETVLRPGSGGPRRHGGLVVYRSSSIEEEDDRDDLHGIPITSVPRTILDLAPHVSGRALARLVREAIRLELTSLETLALYLVCRRSRRGARRLAETLHRYSGLPLHRARSGAEIRALEVHRDAGVEIADLNVEIAGEEADLSWPDHRLIVEIDGGPFHQDRGEDERKQRIWEAAGWTVRRLPSDDVYEAPERLLALTPPSPSPAAP